MHKFARGERCKVLYIGRCFILAAKRLALGILSLLNLLEFVAKSSVVYCNNRVSEIIGIDPLTGMARRSALVNSKFESAALALGMSSVGDLLSLR
jgi:hypothetical protein